MKKLKVNELKLKDFIKLEGKAFPYEVKEVSKKGVKVSELRPYWLHFEGRLSPGMVVNLLNTKKEIAEAKFLKAQRDKTVYPIIAAKLEKKKEIELKKKIE